MSWHAKEKGATPLGDRIKQERIRRGYDLNKFVAETGITCSQITGFENRNVKPNIDNLVKIAQALDCTTDWLLGLEN